jgi:SWI/SNF-related matrix-associated actin-dependent regulator of chromatin subfamily D
VFLSNTSANQTLEHNLKPNDPDYSPCWTFKIEGKLLDSSKKSDALPKFTTFFKQIVIEIQRDNLLFPQGNVIQVTRTNISGPMYQEHLIWMAWK